MKRHVDAWNHTFKESTLKLAAHLKLLVSDYSQQPVGTRLTDVVEGAAGGWRDLEEAWVDERSEGGRGLVFLHVVTRLALQ